MEMKICKKCGRLLPNDMFEEGRHQCKDCRREYRRNKRRQIPEKHRINSAICQKEQGEWLNNQKQPCIICGEAEPVCIDFHHINKDDKGFTIGKHRNWKKSKLLEEIKKCVCLCSNCHRKVHAHLINLEDYIQQ